MKPKIDSPLVSVIIPAYNADKYLDESISSILAQTYKNIEIILIDDASTDDTLSVLRKYELDNANIKVYRNETNMGIGKTRARGINIAKGDYICWQDADDISLPSRISRQVEYLKGHNKVGVVGGFIHFFDEEGDGVIRSYDEHDAELRSKIFRYNPVAQPVSMFRKKVYESVGTYDDKYTVSEDLDMLFRVGTRYHFANIQDVLLKYRQSTNSLTWKNLHKMESWTLDLRRKYSKNPEYNFTIMDWLYNIAQRASMIFPVKLRMYIFRVIRGDK